MKNHLVVMLVCAGSVMACTQSTARPPLLDAIVQKVDSMGVLRASDVVDSALSGAILDSIRLDSSSFASLPTGAVAVILRHRRVVMGVDRRTSFVIYAYTSGPNLDLVQVYAPVVNARDTAEAARMFRALHVVAATLVGPQPDLDTWIDSSAAQVWRSWESARHRSETVKERTVGQYRLAVAGVPPDFFFFGAVRQGR